MKQCLKYWCSPGYPGNSSKDPPASRREAAAQQCVCVRGLPKEREILSSEWVVWKSRPTEHWLQQPPVNFTSLLLHHRCLCVCSPGSTILFIRSGVAPNGKLLIEKNLPKIWWTFPLKNYYMCDCRSMAIRMRKVVIWFLARGCLLDTFR